MLTQLTVNNLQPFAPFQALGNSILQLLLTCLGLCLSVGSRFSYEEAKLKRTAIDTLIHVFDIGHDLCQFLHVSRIGSFVFLGSLFIQALFVLLVKSENVVVDLLFTLFEAPKLGLIFGESVFAHALQSIDDEIYGTTLVGEQGF